MKQKTIANDVHLAVSRMAGTTPLTQRSIQVYIQDKFHSFIHEHLGNDLVINGDLFDGFTVEIHWVLQCYLSLVSWVSNADPEATLTLVAGNHDVGKRNDRLSSFDILAQLLLERFPDRVIVVKDSPYSEPGMHIIPHMLNQDIFNLALEEAKTWPAGWLLLHANVDNGFAEESDHSLNVSREQLLELSKVHKLVFAHEHQARTISMPKGHNEIVVLGNQWPTSIADCLAHGEAQKDGKKYAHTINDTGITAIQTWERSNSYVEMEWTDLEPTQAQFIKVVGKASTNQAAEVITAISKYRQDSEAWVITNSVDIQGIETNESMSQLVSERLSKINILDQLLEHLTEPEATAVKQLLAEETV